MRFAPLLLVAGCVVAGGCAAGTALWPANPSGPIRTLSEISAPKPSRLLVELARIKNPVARPLRFTDEQRETIYQTLRPGDVLLTYTAGVSSNVVVPGQFKHAAIFVGEEAQARNYPPTTLRGETADVIEATGDGVSLTSLERHLETRINRLVVLRPRLDFAAREAYLREVFSYVGDKYDFHFDFTDASRKSCTEVVYWALHGRPGIEFELTTRAGRPTLTADDIVLHHLRHSDATRGFECLLLAVNDPDERRQAELRFGGEAEDQLRRMMSASLQRRERSAGKEAHGQPAQSAEGHQVVERR